MNCITEATLHDEVFTSYEEDAVGLVVTNFTGSTLTSLVTYIPGNFTVANNSKLENLYFTELREVKGHLAIDKSNLKLKKVWFPALLKAGKSFTLDINGVALNVNKLQSRNAVAWGNVRCESFMLEKVIFGDTRKSCSCRSGRDVKSDCENCIREPKHYRISLDNRSECPLCPPEVSVVECARKLELLGLLGYKGY